MQTIIIPFRYGRGKTGNAMTGEKRALVVETTNYPDSFAKMQTAIKNAVQHFSNPKEAYDKCIRWMLSEYLPKDSGAHIQEIEFGAYNFVFFNNEIHPRPSKVKTEDYEIIY